MSEWMTELATDYHNGRVTESLRKLAEKLSDLKECQAFPEIDEVLKQARNPDVPMAFHYYLLLASSKDRLKLKERALYEEWFKSLR